MSFFRPPNHRFHKWGFSVAVGYRIRTSKRKQCRIVEMRIGEAILAGLGWQRGERFEMLWGAGDDFGKLCVRRSDRGVLLRPKTGTFRSLQLTSACTPVSDIADQHGGLWRFNATPKPMTELKHGQIDGRLIIDLPNAWFTCVREPKRFHLAS